ncbi:peptidase inhibitor family I36 protein [Kitasatospora sp. HPMI-4]|uniref:peptidase inhibitor family I36 protein n=1 Tax=Kitasatospora sp. HPMI-4 TaxID=3448443 RepID=UPI003F1A90D4
MRRLTTTLVATLSTVALAAPAAAAPGGHREPSRCPDGAVCGWREANWPGPPVFWSPPFNSETCLVEDDLGPFRSLWNNSGHTVRFYRGGDCDGHYFDLAAGTGSPRTPWPIGSARVLGP